MKKVLLSLFCTTLLAPQSLRAQFSADTVVQALGWNFYLDASHRRHIQVSAAATDNPMDDIGVMNMEITPIMQEHLVGFRHPSEICPGAVLTSLAGLPHHQLFLVEFELPSATDTLILKLETFPEVLEDFLGCDQMRYRILGRLYAKRELSADYQLIESHLRVRLRSGPEFPEDELRDEVINRFRWYF